MGLLSNIVSSVKSSVVGKALDTLSAAFIKPVETVKAIISPTKTVSDVIKEVEKQSLAKNITSTVLNTAAAAATIVGAGAVSAAAKAGTLLPAAATAAKALIPTTTKGKIVAAVAAPVVVGAVIKEPVSTIKAISTAPSELAQFGGDIATFIKEPSISTAKEIIKESPLISAGVAAATIGAGVAAVAPAISGLLTRETIQEQTKVLEKAISNDTIVDKDILPPKDSKIYYPVDTISPSAPITPETKAITPTTTKKAIRRARKKKKPVTNISQRVNLMVSNTGVRNTNYINRRVLLN